MDFRKTLELAATFFREHGQPYGVIGGLALAAYGMPRTTLDLDLVIPATARDDFIGHLEGHGYRTLHASTGYSNHLHDDQAFGRIDVVYVRGSTQQALFASLRSLPGPEGTAVPVPRPEHLIAMKLFSVKNDRSREAQELADIRFLLDHEKVDRRQVDTYISKYGLEDLRDRLFT